MWQQEDDDVKRNWEEAITYCEDLVFASHSDWRLPNIKELRSIVDYDKNFPAIDGTYFPNTNPVWDGTYSYNFERYWSSTSISADVPISACYVSFYQGKSSNTIRSSDAYVRCVRGGQ